MCLDELGSCLGVRRVSFGMGLLEAGRRSVVPFDHRAGSNSPLRGGSISFRDRLLMVVE